MDELTDGTCDAGIAPPLPLLGGETHACGKYPFQKADSIDTYSDTDWAGCPRTRKSISGGVILLGSHILKTYSATQPTISLSRGEAEFYGVVRAS